MIALHICEHKCYNYSEYIMVEMQKLLLLAIAFKRMKQFPSRSRLCATLICLHIPIKSDGVRRVSTITLIIKIKTYQTRQLMSK